MCSFFSFCPFMIALIVWIIHIKCEICHNGCYNIQNRRGVWFGMQIILLDASIRNNYNLHCVTHFNYEIRKHNPHHCHLPLFYDSFKSALRNICIGYSILFSHVVFKILFSHSDRLYSFRLQSSDIAPKSYLVILCLQLVWTWS